MCGLILFSRDHLCMWSQCALARNIPVVCRSTHTQLQLAMMGFAKER